MRRNFLFLPGIEFMDEPLTEVICRQQDCVYFKLLADQPGKVYCRHAEKPYYLHHNPCPLYRMDWQKKGGADLSDANAHQFLKIIKKPIR
jgi:hypothetical protein